ncbi:hypothetical protein ZIOFF_002263 [Zingiber officinale]|uniref:Uncharacterized protein n=1 Tax=Zingiber officinale TaxID=94328 RepID=A0A8J5HZM6_ZINOF|nr:hypothetical protein ZIOFF_002263 [Zingiber officinale]
MKSDDAGGVEIGNVWAGNLESEFAIIREIVDDFPLVAMDTEFPGIAIRHLGDFKCHAGNNNHVLRANVDLLHLIQLGLTFTNAAGSPPPPDASSCGSSTSGSSTSTETSAT